MYARMRSDNTWRVRNTSRSSWSRSRPWSWHGSQRIRVLERLDLDLFMLGQQLCTAVGANIDVALLAITSIVSLLQDNIDGAAIAGQLSAVFNDAVCGHKSHTWERYVFPGKVVPSRTGLTISFVATDRQLILYLLLGLLPKLIVLDE